MLRWTYFGLETFHYLSYCRMNLDTIELDWIEEYQWVDPPRLWEAVSGEGCIQMWSHFQLDSLFSPRPCTKVMGKKARWQPPIFVSCLLIGPNGFNPLFMSSSMLFTWLLTTYGSCALLYPWHNSAVLNSLSQLHGSFNCLLILPHNWMYYKLECSNCFVWGC